MKAQKLKKNSRKQKETLWPWTRKNKIVKIDILPKSIYKSNSVLIKFSESFFTDVEKISTEAQKTKDSPTNPESKNSVENINNPTVY